MPSPNEFEKSLRQAVGLTPQQQEEVLRQGLIQFNQRIPIPQVNLELHKTPAPPVELRKTEISTPTSPIAQPKSSAGPTSEGGGGAGELTPIWIIDDGVAVEYNFSATPV